MSRSLLSFAVIVFAVFVCVGGEFIEKPLPETLPVPERLVVVFDAGNTPEMYGRIQWAQDRFPPCSTFKIVSSCMGLECGIIDGLESKLGYDGTKYENPAWNKDLTLLEAFQFSCVPYFKKLTGKLEKKYVQSILDQLEYGNCDISVWNSNGHNVFWIESSLLISPLEQISVLKKIFSRAPVFSPENTAILKTCMKNGQVNRWTVYGKTGTGRNHNSNFLEAWFVGFAENSAGTKIFFAAHGADPERDVSSPEVREIVMKLLERYCETR